MNTSSLRGIGLMCGTSQDGLDIAEVSFRQNEQDNWSYTLHAADTVDLPDDLRKQISSARNSSAEDYAMLDIALASFMADAVTEFRSAHDSQASFVASHGVTIFHQPHRGLTTQLGSGAVLASMTGLTAVADFRQQDVSKGGQGAPLVPSCDHYLFPTYDATLNLGGFANLSLLKPHLAGMDVGGCNLLLNHLMNEVSQAYDHRGATARKGQVIAELLSQLNTVRILQQASPPSLGMEWLSVEMLPILEGFKNHSLENRLRTTVEHIAVQIGKRIPDSCQEVLVTGGGTHNTFLIERLTALSGANLTVPDAQLIDFKEAICFAFLGARRLLQLPNIIAQTTGAKGDSCAGAVYLP